MYKIPAFLLGGLFIFTCNTGVLACSTVKIKTKIASYCYKNLLEKDNPDKHWLKSSSKPIKSNYKKWYFNKKGMVIVFDTKHVSKALSIPISVTIPYNTLKSWPFTEKKMMIGITYRKAYSI